MTGQHPAPSRFGVPAEMPTAIVGYVPWAVGGYGTLVMEEADVMWGADGAPYLATVAAPGSSGGVVAAGNPRQGAASETAARAQYAAPAFSQQAAGPQLPMYAADGAPYGSGPPIRRGQPKTGQ
jgi:hypothetical protein